MKEHHRFRLFFAWDFQREEDWINRLSRDKGLQLERVGCCHYVFAEREKGAYTYRLELLRRTACDAAEKRYLQAVHAQEVLPKLVTHTTCIPPSSRQHICPVCLL